MDFPHKFKQHILQNNSNRLGKGMDFCVKNSVHIMKTIQLESMIYCLKTKPSSKSIEIMIAYILILVTFFWSWFMDLMVICFNPPLVLLVVHGSTPSNVVYSSNKRTPHFYLNLSVTIPRYVSNIWTWTEKQFLSMSYRFKTWVFVICEVQGVFFCSASQMRRFGP